VSFYLLLLHSPAVTSQTSPLIFSVSKIKMNLNALSPLLATLSQSASGQASILNMRKTSRHIRDFIDRNLRGIIGPDPPFPFTAKLTITLNGTLSDTEYYKDVFHGIQKMIQTPPPPFISGLYFDVEFPPLQQSPVESEMWSRFLRLWKPRLISLTVHKLIFPLSFEELDFLASPSIKMLLLRNTAVDLLKFSYNPQTFPPVCVTSLSELHLTATEHGIDIRKLVNYSKANVFMKVLQMTVNTKNDIVSVTNLLKVKRRISTFRLLLQVKPFVYSPLPENIARLCKVIMKCRCKVDLIGMTPGCITWLLENLNQDEKRIVLECVLTVDFWQRTARGELGQSGI